MIESMRVELQELGYGPESVVFVGINDKGAAAHQDKLVDKGAYPLWQDTEEVDAWGQHGGKKDDMAIYDASGALYAWLPLGGEVDISLAKPESYEALKALVIEAIEGGPTTP